MQYRGRVCSCCCPHKQNKNPFFSRSLPFLNLFILLLLIILKCNKQTNTTTFYYLLSSLEKSVTKVFVCVISLSEIWTWISIWIPQRGTRSTPPSLSSRSVPSFANFFYSQPPFSFFLPFFHVFHYTLFFFIYFPTSRFLSLFFFYFFFNLFMLIASSSHHLTQYFVSSSF